MVYQREMLVSKDSLQPVPLKKAEELLKILRSDLPYSLQAYGALQTFIEWSKKGGRQKLNIYTPHGHLEDGAVVGIYKPTDTYYFLSVYCIGNDTSVLRNALLTTSRIKWDMEGIQVTFEGLSEKLLPVAEECLARNNLQTTLNMRSVKFWLTPSRHVLNDFPCPPEVHVAPLDPAFSSEIQSKWVHTFRGAAGHVEALIDNNFGLGVYLRDTNELCAWVLCNQYSGLGILHTRQEHRRKGYAQIMCHAMNEQLLRSGLLPQANVLASNPPSLKLFRELRFEACPDFFYIEASAQPPPRDGSP
nr:PREDICTED: uncharacterized protein LOC109043477 [Bemisia tabaci]